MSASERLSGNNSSALMEERRKNIFNHDLYEAVASGTLVQLIGPPDPDFVETDLLTIAGLLRPERALIMYDSAGGMYNLQTGRKMAQIVKDVRRAGSEIYLSPETGRPEPTAELQPIASLEEVLKFIAQGHQAPGIYVLPHLHIQFDCPETRQALVPALVRLWKQIRNQHKTVVFTTPANVEMPKELENLLLVVKQKPVGKKQHEEIIDEMLAETGLRATPAARQKALEAMTGLNWTNARAALRSAQLKKWGFGNITAEKILEWKARQMAASDQWTLVPTDVKEVIYGWDLFEGYLDDLRRNGAFDLDSPNAIAGFLIVGLPGTGKTVYARVLARKLGRPLYAANLAGWMGEFMGQTEQRFVEALDRIEVAQPCVALIDEVQRKFGGIETDKRTSGGVVDRGFSELLYRVELWRRSGFQIALYLTANTLDGLPQEFIDRFVTWGVSLPGPKTREAIWVGKIEYFRAKHPKLTIAPEITLEVVRRETWGMAGRGTERLATETFNARRSPVITLDDMKTGRGRMPRDLTHDQSEMERRLDLVAHFPVVSSDVLEPWETPEVPLDEDVIDSPEVTEVDAKGRKRTIVVAPPPVEEFHLDDGSAKGKRRRKKPDLDLTTVRA